MTLNNKTNLRNVLNDDKGPLKLAHTWSSKLCLLFTALMLDLILNII